MKITFKKVAFVAMLTVAAAGCQKENFENQGSLANQIVDTICVTYTINGQSYSTVLFGEEAWQAFIDQMLALAREGYEVSFSRNGNPMLTLTKETVTYVTTSESDAHKWADGMTAEGYIVTIEYNNKTGEYICTAIK